MKQRRRIYYSQAQKDEMWDRWQRGESMHQIAKSFDRNHTSVQNIIFPTGGFRPPPRKRSVCTLSLSERESISRGIAREQSIREIARQLDRAPSTICREINRNGGYEEYRAALADQAAWDRALRPKRCKLACNKRLARVVAQKLKLFWSPKQISGWLKRTYPNNEDNYVSHETIYKSLFIQSRGALKKELLAYLRTNRKIRRPKAFSLKGKQLGTIPNAVSIRERPASIEDRAVPGHWEGDLIEGANKSYIATLVERHTRYVMLAKIAKKDTETVITALIKQSNKLPQELYRSLTWDRGSEIAGHQKFTLATDIDVYLCDPQSPWQRGSNENTNRLLRQYFPKGTDLSLHSQAKLNAVARQLNERPRETLGFETPAERFNACVAAID